MKKPNIILITIDALRADHLGFMGYQKNVSPNLDALAKESTVFTNAFVVGPNTLPSFAGLLTSTYPLDYQGLKRIAKPRVLISEALKEVGYITFALHSNPYLSSFFGYNRGWDYFEDLESPNPTPIDYPRAVSFLPKLFRKVIKELTFSTFPGAYYGLRYLGAKYFKLGLKEPSIAVKLRNKGEFLNQIIKDFIYSIQDEESPFFLWAHYMDVHGPYLPRECYFQNKSYTTLDFLREQRFPQHADSFPKKRALQKYMQNHLKRGVELYDYGVEYVDYQLGELINFLKNENLYNESIICITADHGDEFLEHKGGGHGSRLYNELLHVPLLIKIPKGKPESIEKKVSLIDLSPTLFDLIGIKKPTVFKGKNLFENQSSLIFHQDISENCEEIMYPDKLSQCQIGCQSRGWKYILDHGTQKEELYNLLEDPKEQNNIAQKQPQILQQMREKIKQFEKDNPPLLINKAY